MLLFEKKKKNHSGTSYFLLPSLRLRLLLIVHRCVTRQQRALCPWWSGDKCDVTNTGHLWHIYVCVAPICMQIKGPLSACGLHLILSFCVCVCVCLKCMHVMVCCLGTNWATADLLWHLNKLRTHTQALTHG